MSWTRCGLVMLMSVGVAHGSTGQSLASRVEGAGDGVVHFHYSARPGLCGDGKRYMRLGRSYVGMIDGASGDMCALGPAQVALTIREGRVERVQTWVGPLLAREGRDLGRVAATDAARYLVNVAASGAGHAGAKAILPAVIADSSTVWPDLLSIARDASRSQATRKEALFWLSQYAAGATVGQRNDPFSGMNEEDERDDLKSHAVFVLSQLPHGEGTPQLLDLARSHRDARVRRRALFWLGQSGDERALALFAALLGSS